MRLMPLLFELPNYATWLTGLGILLGAVALGRGALASYRRAERLDTVERSALQRLSAPLVDKFVPQSPQEAQELRALLIRAGLRDEEAVKSFSYARAMIMLGAIIGGLVLLLVGVGLGWAMVLGIGALYVGYKAPHLWLQQRIASRQARISRALPALIDLMVLCLDVGLSVEAAFEKVSFEMQSMEPLLAEEARQMVNEMGAGVVFPQALKRLAERVGIEELTTMSRLIAQASGLGASITQALREYSEAAFTKRMLSLEEHAGKISAWLVMPLTACMLPACLLALAGPAIVIAKRAMHN